MLRLLLLLNIFQQARSVNIALSNINVQPVGCDHLKVTFRVKNEIDHLNGDFKACSGGKCGSASVGNFNHYKDQNKPINIPIDLSPCKSYSRIEIRSYFKDNRTPKKDSKSWQAKAFGNCCPELTSKAPTTTTTTTSATTLEG